MEEEYRETAPRQLPRQDFKADEGSVYHVWGERGSDPGQLDNAKSLCFSGDASTVFVVQNGDEIKRVQEFSIDGKFMREIGVGYMEDPFGIALDGRGNLLVADWQGCKLVVFDLASGQHRFDIVSPFGLSIVDVAVSRLTGCVYIAEFEGNVRVLEGVGESEGDGEGRREKGEIRPIHGTLARSLAVDDAGSIVVVADSCDRVEVLNGKCIGQKGDASVSAWGSDDNCLQAFGEYGEDPDQFQCPQGVAIHPVTHDIVIANVARPQLSVWRREKNEGEGEGEGEERGGIYKCWRSIDVPGESGAYGVAFNTTGTMLAVTFAYPDDHMIHILSYPSE